MEFQFVPVDYDYFDFEGRNYVRLIGRNEKGEKVCVVDSYEPNFYLILKDGADAKKIAEKVSDIKIKKPSRTAKVLRTEILDKKYLGKKVKAVRVFVNNHKDAHDIASEIGDLDGIDKRREYDISLITKYIKEKGVSPFNLYSVEGKILAAEEFGGLAGALDLSICVLASKVSQIKKDDDFAPKILAYDIETDDKEIGKGEILMVSLYGDKLKKVFTWKSCNNAPGYVEFCKDEADMIEKFSESVREYSPDILTGYFSDGFDLPYLRERANINGIKLNIGIDGKEPSFTRGRIPSGKISGIVHVDLYRFIDAVFSQYLQSETLSLNEVAKELIGEEKEDFDFVRLAHMKNKDWLDFFSYNLQDSNVTHKLAQRLWPDLLEFSKVVGEPLFDVTRDRMSSHVENYILHNLDRFNEIAEKRPMHNEIGERKAQGKYEGAFVFEPVPGLYENLVMFDFTSMYASVIVSYNLSKSTFLGDDKFNDEIGFFPAMLKDIIDKRKKYKKELAKDPTGILKAKSNAYKLLANAAYGYQGFFGARYYCREAAASTARLAKDNILSAIDKIGEDGYRILYGDTDSIAFLREKSSKKDILSLLKKINDELPGIMELDLEDFYNRGLFVAKRGSTTGAKKKYALVDEKGNIKIRGFETVRRDWCRLTRELQSKVLYKILEDGNEKSALALVKKVIKKLKDREIELEDLMIKVQLRRPIDEYVSEGPHVVAAKKMIEAGIHVGVGMVIEYFVGEGPGKRVGDHVYLAGEKAKYNIEYYLKNQILPAVENIFDVFGVNVVDIIEGEQQKKLF
jgi:DNA polymerase, archaea type